jgi:hypothetical protein
MAARLSASLVQCIVIGIALVTNQLLASESWVRLTTPNFDLYSDLNRKQAASVINHLEDARTALAALHVGAASAGPPVRVIAFGSEREYAQYRSNDASAAYYLRADGQEYIVLGEELSTGGAPVIHEYVHHLLHQQYQHLPLWLDEGLAEVYSTATRQPKGLRVGLPPQDRLDWLRMDSPAYDLETLFSIRRDSFDNVKHLTPRSRFYAESWLLVHMLRFSPEYGHGFQAFLEDMEGGAPTEAALLKHYGKTLSTVMDDMQAYLKADRMPTEVVRVSTERTVGPVTVSELQRADWQAVLADLRFALTRPQIASSAWTR